MATETETAVVLGGSSGIGLATAQLLGADGMQVVMTGRDTAKLAAAVESVGSHGRGVVVDATDGAQLARCFAEVGAFDHLILALSGGGGAGPFCSLPLDALRAGFEAKFWAHISAAVLALDERWGV